MPISNSPSTARLGVGREKIVNCVFFDEHGVKQRTDGQRHTPIVRFTDLNGQRWERSEEFDLREVMPDDSDLAPPETQ